MILIFASSIIWVVVLINLISWLYLWQLKEYRPDRLLVHLTGLSRREITNLYFFGHFRSHFRPTFRAAAIFLLSVGFLIWPLFFGVNERRLFALGLLNWLFLPILISPIVILTSIPTALVRRLIVKAATEKMKRLKEMTVIGITGSYGKTTTKEFLAQILSRHFPTIWTEGTVNTLLGIALTILRDVKGNERYFIVEMGAYRKGEISEICQMVKPKIGIITGLNQQHLALFGNFENLLAAKYELIESLPSDGIAYFNGENEDCVKLGERTKVRKALYKNNNEFKLPAIIPDFLRLNFSAATIVSKDLGVDDSLINKAAAELKLPKTAPIIRRGIKGAKIIDNGFSANPDGFFAVLTFLNNQPEKNKILVTPGMIELGSVGDRIHREIGRRAAEICREVFVTRSESFRPLVDGWQSGGGMPDKIYCQTNYDRLIMELKNRLNGDTVLLIEGRIAKAVIAALTLEDDS